MSILHKILSKSRGMFFTGLLILSLPLLAFTAPLGPGAPGLGVLVDSVYVLDIGTTPISTTSFKVRASAAITSFAGTISSVGTTITFSSAADAVLAGYSATLPVLGTTIIAGAQTRYIASWTNSTTAVVGVAPSPAWGAGTAITSVQLPQVFGTTSAGVLSWYVSAGGQLYFAGNVGIGTTAPVFPLDVNGTILSRKFSDDTGTLQLGNSPSNQNAKLLYVASGDNSLAISTSFSGGTNNIITFAPGGTERVRFQQNGNVGIGNTAPVAKLQVSGTSLLHGNLGVGMSANLNTSTALNGTGGGNRGFDTSFTGASATGFTGTDSADQGYGYFPVTIVSGKWYRVSATMSVTNGAPLTFITSTGLNFATDLVQTIMATPVSNVTYDFLATGNASYVGIGINRTAGTMSATVSNVSVTELGNTLATNAGNVGIGTTSPTAHLTISGSSVDNGSTGIDLTNTGGNTFRIAAGTPGATQSHFTISQSGTSHLSIANSTGNVGINTIDLDGTPAVGKLTVKSTTNDGSSYPVVVRDSDEANITTVNSNGDIYTVGNISTGAATFGTSAAKNIGLGEGILATTAPADMVQVGSQNYNGNAGDNRWHFMGEATANAKTAIGSGKISIKGAPASQGGFTRQLSEATSGTLSGASGSIAVNVPSGARLLGVQLRVDTLITSADGATSWTAVYVNTPTTAITSGRAFTANTKFNAIHPAYEITTGTVTITITPNSNTFSGGVVRAIVYFEAIDATASL